MMRNEMGGKEQWIEKDVKIKKRSVLAESDEDWEAKKH